jgi:hypothetical protein
MKGHQHKCKSTAIVCILTAIPVAATAQSKSPIKKDTIHSTIGANPVIKDESGKILTFNQMIALTKTGDYKVDKKLDKDNKPYLLVQKAPGFSPRPESPPVVVRPNH